MRLKFYELFAFVLLIGFSACSSDDDDTNPDDTGNQNGGDGQVTEQTQEVSGNINDDIVWSKQTNEPGAIDYLVTGDINLNAQMTIEPGVKVAFREGVFFDVESDGLLLAEGTADDMIHFTGSNTEGGQFWGGIRVYSSDNRNILKHARIEYGGEINIGLHSGSSISVLHCEIANAGEYGLADLSTGGGTIVAFENNIFDNNGSYAIGVFPDNVGVIDENTTFTGNGYDGVQTGGGDLTEEATWVKLNGGAKYIIFDDFEIHAPFTIDPGATFEVDENVSIIVQDGYISAEGTASEKITFTSSNIDGGQKWKGLRIETTDVRNVLDHVVLEHAGNSDMRVGGFWRGGDAASNTNLAVSQNSTIKVTNSTFSHSGGFGILVKSGATIDGTIIENETDLNDLEAGNNFDENGNGDVDNVDFWD